MPSSLFPKYRLVPRETPSDKIAFEMSPAQTTFDTELMDDYQGGLAHRSSFQKTVFLVVANAVELLVIAALALQLIAKSSTDISHQTASDVHMNDGLKASSAYSPIFDKVNLTPRLQFMNGALRDNTSIWRQPPSREVDAAWDWLSAEDMQLITVSASDLTRSGKDPAISVEAPPSWQIDGRSYIAQVEVFHQIHCLNVLRKEVHQGYYFKDRKVPSELDRSHSSHCIHMLLQHLICNADVGIISHYWLHDDEYNEPKTRPFADFSTQKKCRDFASLMAWLRKEGGVREQEKKFPMTFPGGDTPFTHGRGYSVESQPIMD